MHFGLRIESVNQAEGNTALLESFVAPHNDSGSVQLRDSASTDHHAYMESTTDYGVDDMQHHNTHIAEAVIRDNYFAGIIPDDDERLAIPVKGGSVGSGFYRTDTSTMSNPKRNRGRKSKLHIRY